MQEPWKIAIIGAGFSGVMSAVHLLREAGERPIQIYLVNRGGRMARGVAYGTRSPVHMLNVPAARMSALPDEPEHFLRFAQSRDAAVTPTTFLPRSVYGEYLEDTLDKTEAAFGRPAVERVVAEVLKFERVGNQRRLHLNDGKTLDVHRVILALGNFPPRDLDVIPAAVRQSERYVRDPWAPGAMNHVDVNAPILLLGTGLTMIDAALDLQIRGASGPILALSRHGLLPQPHQPSVPPEPKHRPPGIDSGPATIRAYMHAVRERVKELTKNEIGWRTVIDSLRPITTTLWQRMPISERARFLRHVRAYWEVVRHRAAAAPAGEVAKLIDAGTMTVRAGRICEIDVEPEAFNVTYTARKTGKTEQVRMRSIVNCTGPSLDVRRSGDPLMRFLIDEGTILPDTLDLGIELDLHGAVLDAYGESSLWLYYVGPLARAGLWECTAVPELRLRAREVARRVLESLIR